MRVATHLFFSISVIIELPRCAFFEHCQLQIWSTIWHEHILEVIFMNVSTVIWMKLTPTRFYFNVFPLSILLTGYEMSTVGILRSLSNDLPRKDSSSRLRNCLVTVFGLTAVTSPWPHFWRLLRIPPDLCQFEMRTNGKPSSVWADFTCGENP